MKLRVPQKAENLTKWDTISFSGRTLLHGVQLVNADPRPSLEKEIGHINTAGAKGADTQITGSAVTASPKEQNGDHNEQSNPAAQLIRI